MITRNTRLRRMAISATVVAALATSGIGVASAQSSTTTTTPTSKVAKPGKRAGRHSATIAKALGITEAELRTELAAGKTIAQIAAAKGVDLQKVIDALVADEAAEHPEWTKEQVLAHVTARVNGTGGPGGKGGGRGGKEGRGRGAGKHGAAAATALGITQEELRTELAAGKTIAQVAAARGVDVQKVIDAIVAEVMAEHPDAPKADVVAHVTNMVNGVRPARPEGARRGGGGKGRGRAGSGSTSSTPAAPTSSVAS